VEEHEEESRLLILAISHMQPLFDIRGH